MNRFVIATALLASAAACSSGRDRNTADTGAAMGRADSAGMTMDSAGGAVGQQPGTAGGGYNTGSGTGAGGRSGAGTGTSGGRDSTQNQTQSGVTDTRSGASTLGPGAKRTDPTGSQPVTGKGDTLSRRKQPR